ncbi:MAG: hypothetical protein ACHQ53_13005 [Polyangiales bacterium]
MLRLVPILLCVIVAGCDALQAFRTAPGEVFSGEVIGSDSQASQPSFIRQGFDSHTQMALTFDPAKAAAYLRSDAGAGATLPAAGTIDTYSCPTASGACPSGKRAPGYFQNANLEVIPNLTHDPLSEYDFPGGGRLRNYMLISRFESVTGGVTTPRAAMVFLSLMENGGIEARVISPSVLDQDGKTELHPALFGVFLLSRHKSTP